MTQCSANKKATTDPAINSFETLKGSNHIPETIWMITSKGIADSEGFSMLVVRILIACAAANDSHDLNLNNLCLLGATILIKPFYKA